MLKGKLHIGGGTWGSIMALPFAFILLLVAKFPYGHVVYLMAVAVIMFAGVASIPATEACLGLQKNWRGKMVQHDQSQIVIDEVWGIMITAWPLLWINPCNWWIAMSLVFVLFRFFDITKIWPINLLDRWENEWGVMLDDGMAGVYAAVSLVVINCFFHF